MLNNKAAGAFSGSRVRCSPKSTKDRFLSNPEALRSPKRGRLSSSSLPPHPDEGCFTEPTAAGASFAVLGTAYFLSRRFGEAVPKLLFAIQEDPGLPYVYRYLAACYAHMGQLKEARAIIEKLRVITPVIIPGVIPFRNPEHRELLLSGLRLAAGEAK